MKSGHATGRARGAVRMGSALVAACRTAFFTGLFALTTAQAAPCTGRLDPAAPLVSSGFGQNLANTRQAPSAIHAANVARLQPALLLSAGSSVREKRGTPATTTQAIFLTAGRSLQAVDRLTGCEYWTYTAPNRVSLQTDGLALRSSAVLLLPAPSDASRPPLVLSADNFGVVHAVHALTGQLVWKRFAGTDADHHMVTGALQVADGKLLVPLATKEVSSVVFELFSSCCKSHGLLHAMDPYTGATLWLHHTAPAATYDWFRGTRGPSGMSVWGAPAVDLARRLVFIGTGQNLGPPATANSDAIVALDLDSGAERWVFQAQSSDVWNLACQASFPFNSRCPAAPGGDFDFGAAPILARLPDGGQALLAGNKNGTVYSLDPATGRLNWARRIGAGANLGGIHWGMAVDAERVYAAVSDVQISKLTLLGGLWLASARSQTVGVVPNARPGVYALSLLTGEPVWEAHPQHQLGQEWVPSAFSAAVSVTNDVVFAGSLDGRVHAWHSSTGAPLWSYDTAVAFTDAQGRAGQGGTIDSVGPVVAGDDLLVNSGYATFGGPNRWMGGPGNALFVFRLAP